MRLYEFVRDGGKEPVRGITGFLLFFFVCAFISGLFGGAFVTGGFIPMTPASWPFVVGARLAWQVGGAVGLSAVLVAAAVRYRGFVGRAVIGGVLVTLVGSAFALNAIVAVLSPPIEGRVVGEWRRPGFAGRPGSRPVTIVVASASGAPEQVDFEGFHGSVWQQRSAECGVGTPVDVRILAGLNALVAVTCVRR